MLRAVIFDWDGVVVDSSAHHERSWEILAAGRGLPLPPDHFKRGFGKKNNVIIPDLGWATDPAEVDALAHAKEEIYRSLVREKGIAPLPGVRDLLSALRTADIPRAIGSSTERANLDCLLDMMDLRTFFDVIVSGEEVVHGKPDPSIFLLAAERLGLAPADCLVIEDALVGIEAARRAGMPVLAVATTEPLEALRGATAAVPDLRGVTVDTLGALVDPKKT
jgi:beta-phosphoglucomutase family hydrolase